MKKKKIFNNVFVFIHSIIPLICLIVVLTTENPIIELAFCFFGFIFSWQIGWGMSIDKKRR